MKFKFAGDGTAEILRPAPTVPAPTVKLPVTSKVMKATKKENEFKSVRLIQEVALATEPVYGGVADGVKTRGRKCRNEGIGFYSEFQERVKEIPRKKQVKRKNAESWGRPEKKKQLGHSSGQVEEMSSANLQNLLEFESIIVQKANHVDQELQGILNAVIETIAEDNQETFEETLKKCLPGSNFDEVEQEQVPIEPVFGKFKLFNDYL